MTMTKYDKMVEFNKKLCDQKLQIAKNAIAQMLKDNERVTAVALAKKTGLSRAYFYTNEEAHAAYNKAKIEQDGVIFVRPQQVILNTAMEHQLQVLKNRIASLEKENTELRKENEKLKKARNKVDLAFIKKL